MQNQRKVIKNDVTKDDAQEFLCCRVKLAVTMNETIHFSCWKFLYQRKKLRSVKNKSEGETSMENSSCENEKFCGRRRERNLPKNETFSASDFIFHAKGDEEIENFSSQFFLSHLSKWSSSSHRPNLPTEEKQINQNGQGEDDALW